MDNVIHVVVKPKSRKSEISRYDHEKKVYTVNLRSPPENGKANLELIKLFKKKFNKDVKIIKGKTSKKKLLLVK